MSDKNYEHELSLAMRKFIDGDIFDENDALILSSAEQDDLFRAFMSANSQRLLETGNLKDRMNRTRNFSSFSLAVSCLRQGSPVKIDGEIVNPTTKEAYQTKVVDEKQGKSF